MENACWGQRGMGDGRSARSAVSHLPSPGGATVNSQGCKPLVGRIAIILALEGRRNPSCSMRRWKSPSPFQGSHNRCAAYQGFAPLAIYRRPSGAKTGIGATNGSERVSEGTLLLPNYKVIVVIARWTTCLALFLAAAFGSAGLLPASAGEPPAGTAAAASRPVTELFTRELLFGNGTGGPYPLSWTQVVPGTEAVRVDRRPAHYGLDYLLDYPRGTVQFTRPLARGSVAEVEYRYD